MPTNHFYFYGFLSKKGNEAKKALEELKERQETLLFYESPHQIEETIKLLFDVFGDRNCVIARELTKINEEYITGTLKELQDLDYKTLKGEMVIVLEGNNEVNNQISDTEIKEKLKFYMSLGVTEKAAILIAVEELKVPKNRVYRLAQELK